MIAARIEAIEQAEQAMARLQEAFSARTAFRGSRTR
jgi:hypothetical protein